MTTTLRKKRGASLVARRLGSAAAGRPKVSTKTDPANPARADEAIFEAATTPRPRHFPAIIRSSSASSITGTLSVRACSRFTPASVPATT